MELLVKKSFEFLEYSRDPGFLKRLSIFTRLFLCASRTLKTKTHKKKHTRTGREVTSPPRGLGVGGPEATQAAGAGHEDLARPPPECTPPMAGCAERTRPHSGARQASSGHEAHARYADVARPAASAAHIPPTRSVT